MNPTYMPNQPFGVPPNPTHYGMSNLSNSGPVMPTGSAQGPPLMTSNEISSVSLKEASNFGSSTQNYSSVPNVGPPPQQLSSQNSMQKFMPSVINGQNQANVTQSNIPGQVQRSMINQLQQNQMSQPLNQPPMSQPLMPGISQPPVRQQMPISNQQNLMSQQIIPPSQLTQTGKMQNIPQGQYNQPQMTTGPVNNTIPSPTNMPGLPSLDNGPNQLSNQMSTMNINSQRVPQKGYSSGPQKPIVSPLPGDYTNGSQSGIYPNPNYPLSQNTFNTQQSINSNLSGPPDINSTGQPYQGPHMPPPLNQSGMPAVSNQVVGQRGTPISTNNYVNGIQQPRVGVLPPQPSAMGYPTQQSGVPPMPSQMSGPYVPPQPGYPQQPQPQRRLDPDQMPSPIQVMVDDQKTRSGVFCTNQKGLVPPLVTTNFITQDQGNSGPRYIRSTMYNVPVTMDMMKQAAVPFGVVISPLAKVVDQEYPPQIVNFGELGPVRCIRCKAYMCPFMQFIDSGRRFQCLLCKATTDVPQEYFQHLDHTGQRVDRYERPELVLGTYEFIATKDYCRNNTYPKPPAMIFVLDVSYNNIKSGLIHLLCAEMKQIIKNLPIDQGQETSNMKVGFITYNSTVHFYNIKGSLAQPQMLIVSDVQEMFMPLLDGFLCDVNESETVIDSLMEQIPNMFCETKETETILAPAIQAGLEALKASDCAGKLLVFHSSLPIADAPGKLKNRDDRKLLGTEKERTVLFPQNNVYNNLGQECASAGCSVDLYVFNNSYIDIATIGQVSRLTGGEVYKYTYFQADIDGNRLIQDIINNISRPIAFDAIMRVRTSTGVRATDFYGHFYMSNTTDMELASIDCYKSVAIEIKHDDKLTEEDGIYIQSALLYTSCAGQRRLRILNLSLKTCSQFGDLFRSCDLDTVMNFYAKQCTFKLLEGASKAVKDGLVLRCAQTLACYRKHCASPSSAGQLILPECMKLMPLYLNCLLKSDALSGGSDMTLDDRSFVMQALMTMDVLSSMSYFYPRLLPIHDIDINSTEIPQPVRCSIEKMVDNGVYILENGIHMFLWLGLNTNSEWVQAVFGVSSAAQANLDVPQLPVLDNPLSSRIRSLIESIRIQRHRYMRLTLVRQRDKLENVLKHFLVEDRGVDGSPGYVEFLCHMHKEIRTILS